MSEAERLADLLERDPSEWGGLSLGWKAAAELRRLSAELEECQAQRRAAIEAQGVPMVADFDQLKAMQAEWHAVSHDNSITSEAKFQRVYKAAMLASAPPAQQGKPLSDYEWDEVG